MSPGRTALPRPTRTSATVPPSSGAMVALRVARTVPTTSVTTTWGDRSARPTRIVAGAAAGWSRGADFAAHAATRDSTASAAAARYTVSATWPNADDSRP